MTTAHRRPVWLAAGFSVLLVVGLTVVLASGILSPPPSSSPVAIATVSPSVAVSPGMSPAVTPTAPATASPSPSPEATGTVATRIIISRLGIDLPIYEGDGTTAEVGKAAHYPTTGWPGGGSLVYLYAHARDGNFIGLWDAEVGDMVELDLEDGSTATYVVSRIDPKVAWNDLSMLDPTPNELLRLQTCNSYQETAPRFIVEAVPPGERQ